jgi:hypothetical protein
MVVCFVAKVTVLCCRSFSSYFLLLCALFLRLLYNAEGALVLTPYCCVALATKHTTIRSKN